MYWRWKQSEKSKTWTHDAAKLKAVVDFHQLIELVLVQHDELVQRCTDLPSTVEAVNDVFPVLFQNEQNVEYFHLKPTHLNNGPLAANRYVIPMNILTRLSLRENKYWRQSIQYNINQRQQTY